MKIPAKNTGKLLALFFSNPEKSFYMREIGRILGKKPGTFQRTLNNMVSEGILQSEYKTNSRYFKANKKYFLYKEFKSIVSKTTGIQDSIKEVLNKIGKVKFAFIYGSFAKNKEKSISDIDIFVVGNPDENLLIRELDKLEERLQREINYKLYSTELFKKDVKQKDPFILSVLKDKKIMFIGKEYELRKIC
ncbi:MAG: nucleotidyltransferase domain-containing protein [Candidatus Omnitrophota bacterium]